MSAEATLNQKNIVLPATPKPQGNYVLVEVFGEAISKHARSAVGMSALPNNICVEIEMILEVE